MKRFVVPALTLAILVAPGLADAQQRGGGRGLGGAIQQNPIQAILTSADSLQLSLTADQTTRLEALGAEVDAANAPRLAQIQGAAGGGDFTALMPVLQAIQTENQGAITRAREGILTAEQWTKVEPFLAAQGGRGGRGGARGGGARGGGAPG